MNDIPVERLHYELPEIWEEEWFPLEDHTRVRATAALVPVEAKSLLDVGCGNGLFLNYLLAERGAQFDRLAGVDRSETALGHVRTEKYLGTVNALPFVDSEFDVVTSSEVIEHLPLPIYDKSISEIARVAKNMLMICVPYKQNLEKSLSKCPECCARFNADFHVRSFDEDTLTDLFRPYGFGITSLHYLGAHTTRYDQEFRSGLRCMFRKAEPYYPSYAICPVCGFSDQEKLLSDLADRKRAKAKSSAPEPPMRSAIRRLLASLMPTRTTYRWILVVYARDSAATALV